MVTAKKPEPNVINNTGANITHCHIENKAAAVSEEAARALGQLAMASAEHAKAITAIANALKGAEAHMQHGIYLSDLKGS